jgi:hypothetical protein
VRTQRRPFFFCFVAENYFEIFGGQEVFQHSTDRQTESLPKFTDLELLICRFGRFQQCFDTTTPGKYKIVAGHSSRRQYPLVPLTHITHKMHPNSRCDPHIYDNAALLLVVVSHCVSRKTIPELLFIALVWKTPQHHKEA